VRLFVFMALPWCLFGEFGHFYHSLLIYCTFDVLLLLTMYGMQNGVTALYRAAASGNLSTVKYLIKMGADLNIPARVSRFLS